MSFSFTISYLRSLLLASVTSFIAPLALLGSAIAFLFSLSTVPGFGFVQTGADQILVFLATFGNGNAWEGAIVIGSTCALVGALFDTYTFYRHYNFRKL